MKVISLRGSAIFTNPDTEEQIQIEPNVDYIVPDYIHGQIKEGNKRIISKDRELYSQYKKYNGQSLENKALLVLRTGGIGDLIFIVPSVRYLKQKYPTSKIFLICGSRMVALFKGLSCYHDVLEMPASMKELSAKTGYPLTSSNCYAVSFERMVEISLEAKIKNIYELHKDNFGIKDNIDYKPEIFISQKDVVEMKEKYINPKAINIIYQFTSSSPIRTYKPLDSIEFFNAWDVVDNVRFIVVDSPSKKPFVEFYLERFKNTKLDLWSVVGDTSISQMAALVSCADLVVTPDSSISHIAGCFDVPIVGIFGAFHSNLRLSTYKNAIGVNVMSNCSYAEESLLKSCFQHGDICLKAMELNRIYAPCMDGLKPQILVDIVKDALLGLKLLRKEGDKLYGIDRTQTV